MTTPRYLLDRSSNESWEAAGHVEEGRQRRHATGSTSPLRGEEKQSSPLDRSEQRRMHRSIASATPSTVDLSVSDQSLDQRSIKSGRVTISGDRLLFEEPNDSLTTFQQSASTFHSFSYHMDGLKAPPASQQQGTPRPTVEEVYGDSQALCSPPPPSIQSTLSQMAQSSNDSSSGLGLQLWRQQQQRFHNNTYSNSPPPPGSDLSNSATNTPITSDRDGFESAQSAYNEGVQAYLRQQEAQEQKAMDGIISPYELALIKRAAPSPSTPTVATTPTSETFGTPLLFDESPATQASFAQEFQQTYLVSEDDDDEGSSSDDWTTESVSGEESATESQIMRETLPSNFYSSQNLLGTPDKSPEEIDLFGSDPMSNEQFFDLSLRPEDHVRDLVGAPEVSKPPIFSPSPRSKQKKQKSHQGKKKKKSKKKKAKSGKEKKRSKNKDEEKPNQYRYHTMDVSGTTRRTLDGDVQLTRHHYQFPQGNSAVSILQASTASSPSPQPAAERETEVAPRSPKQTKFTSISLLENEVLDSPPSDEALLHARRPGRSVRPRPNVFQEPSSQPPSQIVVSPRKMRPRSEGGVLSPQEQQQQLTGATMDSAQRRYRSHNEQSLMSPEEQAVFIEAAAAMIPPPPPDEPPVSQTSRPSKRRRSFPLEGSYVGPEQVEFSRRRNRSEQSYLTAPQMDFSRRTHASAPEQRFMSPRTPSRRTYRSSLDEAFSEFDSSHKSNGSRRHGTFRSPNRQLDASIRSNRPEKGGVQSPQQFDSSHRTQTSSRSSVFMSPHQQVESSRTSHRSGHSPHQFDSSQGSQRSTLELGFVETHDHLASSQRSRRSGSQEAFTSQHQQHIDTSHRSQRSGYEDPFMSPEFRVEGGSRRSSRSSSPHDAFANSQYQLDSYGRVRRSRSLDTLGSSSQLDSSARSRRSRSQEPMIITGDILPRDGSLYPLTSLIKSPMPPEVDEQLDSSRRSRRSISPRRSLSASPTVKPTLERKDESYRLASPYDQEEPVRKAELKSILKSTSSATVSTQSEDLVKLAASHSHDSHWNMERVTYVPYVASAANAAKQPEVVYDERQMHQRSPPRTRTTQDLEYSNRSGKTTSTAHSSLLASDAFDGYGDSPGRSRVRFALHAAKRTESEIRKEGYVPDAFGQFSSPESAEPESPPGNDYTGTTWFTRPDDSLNSFLTNESDARPVELRGSEKWRIWCRQVQWFWVGLVTLGVLVIMGVCIGLAVGLRAGKEPPDSSDVPNVFETQTCSLPAEVLCVGNVMPSESIPTCVSGRYEDVLLTMNITRFAPDSCEASNVAAWAVATLTDGSESVEHVVELFALAAIYFSTEPTKWVRSDGWLLPGEACLQWKGVTCQQGRVVKIELDSNNLSGSLPSEIGYLSNLEFISMRSNDIRGELPIEMTSLSKLSYLNLRTNDMEGELPFRFGDMGALETLLISSNRFSGTLPSSLGDLSRLTTVHAGQNKFTGAIPSEFGKLQSIETIILSSNRLKDSIPTELGQLTLLKDLRLDDGNWFAGSAIPTELAQLVRLEKLVLDNLALSGGIPTEFGALTAMTDLSLRGNRLGGTLPVELSQLKSLVRLRLQLSEIEGTLPAEWAELAALTELDVSSNKLTGTIPSEYGGLSALERFFARDNDLVGEIPSEICGLRPDLLLVGDFCTGELTCVDNPDCCECIE